MLCDCFYDPVRDVQAVEQNGFVDLAQANAMSSIPANLSVEQLSYNEIDDPNAIAGRPSDTFEAAQMATAISSYKAPESEKSE